MKEELRLRRRKGPKERFHSKSDVLAWFMDTGQVCGRLHLLIAEFCYYVQKYHFPWLSAASKGLSDRCCVW